MKSTITSPKSTVTIGRSRITVYQNKKAAETFAAQHQYFLKNFTGPIEEWHLQKPGEVYVKSISILNLIDACKQSMIKGRIPSKLLNGYVVMIDYLEFCNENECDFEGQVCLDYFVQERCYKRMYPIFMRKNEAFIQWSKYQYNSTHTLPIQRRTMHIKNSVTLSVKELANYFPNLMKKINVSSRNGYTNVITYQYTDENDKNEYVELLPIFLENLLSERFNYF